MPPSASSRAPERDSRHRQLGDGARALGVELNPRQIQLMLDHLDLLVHWNRRLNLTAITARPRMLVEHILDSLSVLPHLGGPCVLDIGSGGGFPGIPLAIAGDESRLTLLDSRGRRIEFLRYVVGRLGLTNAHPVNARVEDHVPEQPFDSLVCRAFASLPDILELTTHLLIPGVELVAMKGKRSDDELATIDSRFDIEVVQINVPGLDAERHLVKVRAR